MAGLYTLGRDPAGAEEFASATALGPSVPGEAAVDSGVAAEAAVETDVARGDITPGTRRMAAWMGLVLLVYAAWRAFHWPSGDRVVVGDVFSYPVSAAAVGAALAASRRCQADQRLRSAWQLLGYASLAYFVGDILQTAYELAGSRPYPSFADAAYLSFYPLALAGLLRFPSPRRTPAQVARLALDLAVVAIGGVLVVTFVVLGPTVLQSSPSVLQTIFSVAYPVGDMVLIIGAACVLLRSELPGSRLALNLLGAGFVCYVVADLVHGYVTLHSTYTGGDVLDSLWMVAIALLAVAASAQRPPDSQPAVPRKPRTAAWLPYIALAVGFGLLLNDLRGDRLLPDGALIIGCIVLATLISLRQLLAQHDLLSTQAELSHRSLHDDLTNLANHALVLDRGQQMLARARLSGRPVGVLHIDVDGFKHVNESLGRGAGDELLRLAARRLSGTVRPTDTVGRLGADEFVILLDESAGPADPEMAAGRVRCVLSQPITLQEGSRRSLSLTVSIGIATDDGGASIEELLRRAEVALHEAKRTGRNRWTAFEQRMEVTVHERLEVEMGLERALDDDELFLLYQPIVDLRSQRITGVEALVRWRDPVRGVIGPATFIPIAEDSGQIVAIGRWVLRAACAQAAAWRREGVALSMSVNLSVRQLEDQELLRDLSAILAEHALPPEALMLEITESALMRDPEAAGRRLCELKSLGVRLAIDDFGTGYSSLSCLRQFPLDRLKIDRSFVSDLPPHGPDVLLHTLVQLGKDLRLETLAEGIEHPGQLAQLSDEGCDTGQGFLFARPEPPERVAALVKSSWFAEPALVSGRLLST